MQQTRTYRERSLENLVKARQELAEGDLTQASEKGWGAAALMVKAVAELRGWNHKRHSWLHDAVDDLVSETGDNELNFLFGVANGLHINFYEGWYRPRQVEAGIQAVERFVAKVEPLLAEAS